MYCFCGLWTSGVVGHVFTDPVDPVVSAFSAAALNGFTFAVPEVVTINNITD